MGLPEAGRGARTSDARDTVVGNVPALAVSTACALSRPLSCASFSAITSWKV